MCSVTKFVANVFFAVHANSVIVFIVGATFFAHFLVFTADMIQHRLIMPCPFGLLFRMPNFSLNLCARFAPLTNSIKNSGLIYVAVIA
jgi:hypothetical protein